MKYPVSSKHVIFDAAIELRDSNFGFETIDMDEK